MIAKNLDGDVIVAFHSPYSINRLLNNMGEKLIVPKEDRRDLFVYRKVNTPKFSVNKNGEYRLFSSVQRGHIFIHPNGHIESFEYNVAGSMPGCYSHKIYDDDQVKTEAYSEYNQSINDKYRRLSYELEIRI